MRVNNKKKSLINPNHNLFSLFNAVVIALFFLSGTALAVDTQCKPDNILVSGFENELPLLFEDTFEGCRSPLWREFNGNWQVTDGAYHTSEFSNSNWLPLEPNNFTVELEMSDIQGGGLWMRLADGSGVILQIGSTSNDDFLYWQVLEADVLGPALSPSANGVITPSTGKHIIKVVVEGAIYAAYVDGNLATTLSHTDIIDAGATPPARGVVGLQGHGTSTRFDRIRIWGKNVSTMQIEFTSDQSVLLESIGQTYQFAAHVINSLGEDVPGIELNWSIEPNALVSLTASDAGSATVQANALGVDSITLRASVPSLQLTNEAQILLADLAVDANYIDSNVVIDNGYVSGEVVLVRNAETELIQVGNVLVSGDRAGLLVRVLTVTITADQVILTFEPAKITDAFQNLDIDGSSAVQSLSVQFNAVTNSVKVKSSTKDGVARIQSFSIDGLKCNAEDQSDFGLTLKGGSIDWEIENELQAALIITNSIVQEFSFSATQSLVLTAATGSLEFSSVLAGKVTCELPLPKFETPTLPISVFSFGLGVQPKVGLTVSGSISGPSFTIEGPKGKLKDSATEGIKYTPGSGWVPIGAISNSVENVPISAMFDTNTEINLDASAYGGVGFEMIANLGKGILSYELATVEFAEVNSDVTMHSEISSPFDPSLRAYTGPNWDVKGNIKGLYKSELSGGALQQLLETLDVPTTLPFGDDIFSPISEDLAHSPRVSQTLECMPRNCTLNADIATHEVTLNFDTDNDEDGSIEYLVSIDAATNLQPLTSAALSQGASSTSWSPSENDPEGTYEVSARLQTDALSAKLPYASMSPGRFSVGTDLLVGWYAGSYSVVEDPSRPAGPLAQYQPGATGQIWISVFANDNNYCSKVDYPFYCVAIYVTGDDTFSNMSEITWLNDPESKSTFYRRFRGIYEYYSSAFEPAPPENAVARFDLDWAFIDAGARISPIPAGLVWYNSGAIGWDYRFFYKLIWSTEFVGREVPASFPGDASFTRRCAQQPTPTCGYNLPPWAGETGPE